MKIKQTKTEQKAAATIAELRKDSQEAVLQVAKFMRENTGDARVRNYRINSVLDGFKGSVAVEIYQRAEIRNARLGAVRTVLVQI